MKAHDPFTGHVVLRNTDSANPGADYRLWTTIKVPVGCGTLEGHCDILKRHVGADDYVLLPARGVFALAWATCAAGTSSPATRRRNPPPCRRRKPSPSPDWNGKSCFPSRNSSNRRKWWKTPVPPRRADGLSTEEYCRTAEELDRKQVIGRFATFLEHVRAKTEDGPVTKYNGLFHWTVPAGMEIRAGSECGRHICMTHCYWRTGGDVFGGAQIMGVVHGLERDSVMEHKAAIDRHLDAKGIPVLHTAVFWGERSEIKPSEISPEVYEKWLEDVKAAPTLP